MKGEEQEMGGKGNSQQKNWLRSNRARSPENLTTRLTTTSRNNRKLSRVVVQFAGHDIQAVNDTAASDNFIYSRYLGEAELKNFKDATGHTDLAVDEIAMRVIGEIDLEFTIEGHPMIATFLVIEEVRDPMILGIPWNDEQEVIYNHLLRCTYARKNKRIMFYLIDGPLVRASGNIDPTHIPKDLPTELNLSLWYSSIIGLSIRRVTSRSCTRSANWLPRDPWEDVLILILKEKKDYPLSNPRHAATAYYQAIHVFIMLAYCS